MQLRNLIHQNERPRNISSSSQEIHPFKVVIAIIYPFFSPSIVVLQMKPPQTFHFLPPASEEPSPGGDTVAPLCPTPRIQHTPLTGTCAKITLP